MKDKSASGVTNCIVAAFTALLSVPVVGHLVSSAEDAVHTLKNRDNISNAIEKKHVSAVDGDTIEDSEGNRYQLHGINALGLNQICYNGGRAISCGKDAKDFLQEMIDTKAMTCSGIDPFEDYRVTCQYDGKDVGGIMIKSGHALFIHGSTHVYYRNEQEYATRNNIGIAAANVRFQ